MEKECVPNAINIKKSQVNVTMVRRLPNRYSVEGYATLHMYVNLRRASSGLTLQSLTRR